MFILKIQKWNILNMSEYDLKDKFPKFVEFYTPVN